MEKQFSYRIVKIGGKAVAVALTALGLMAGSASAADVYLGTALSQAAPNDGTTATIARWNVGDYWDYQNYPTASYGVSTSRAGDVFYGNTVTYSGTGYTSVIGGVAYNAYPWGNSNPVTGTIGYLDDSWPWVGIDAQRTGTFVANVFGDITDGTAGNNYHFGAGTTVGNYSRGSKAYAYGTYWTYGSHSDAAWSIAVYSGMAAGTPTNYAIDINGDASFAGNNTINGDARLQTAYIDGSNVIFNGDVASVGGLVYRTAGSASLNGGGDLTGSVNFQGHNATLTLSNGSNITGSVLNSATDNGTLNFEGSSVVTGAVGTVNALNVTGAGSRVQLNTVFGDTTVNTLTISADKAVVEVGGKLTGNVNMGGHTSKLELLNGPSANAGMSGVLDFGKTTANDGKGTLEIGDGVNVTLGAGGIELARAANSTLLFAGSSIVTGNVGSSDASVTPYKIYAGAGTSTVTFNGRVYVGAGDLNVGPSNTTVKLNAGLTGDLVFGTGTPVSLQGDAYSTYGDGGLVVGDWGNGGTVELSNGQTITGSITTVTNGTGSMKFMGSSAYLNDIGTSGAKLASVTFNAATAGSSVAPVVSTITGNVYSNLVTVGNGSAYTVATLTPGAHILGNALTLAGANTVLNLDGAFNTGYTQNADGTLSNAASNRVTVEGGTITTNGATLNFSVDAGNVLAKSGQVVPATSSAITTTGTLVMNGAEKVNVALLGSTRNGATATLIGVGSNATLTGPAPSGVTDNSFVIDTQVSETSAGLVMTASRASTQYTTKSGTEGHFSNAAANRLGALAAAGAGYTGDMQTVFNKLDINQWGFGNNQANLATQVKRLAPIANASGAQAALASTTSVLTAVGERLSVLRGDAVMAGLNGNGRQMGTDNTGWVKVLGSSGKADAIADYDGYKVTNSGLVAGADAKFGNGVVGGSFSYVTSNISQQDFRLGDTAKMNSGTLAVYGTQEYGDVYVDAALAFSQHQQESNRATAIARVAKADVDMNQTTLKLSAGYRIGIDESKVNVLTPMVSIEAASLKQKAYTETGADALSLNVDGKNMTRNRASLGLRFNTTIEGDGTTFYPEFLVALNRNNGMRNTDVAANYVGDTAAASFTTTGVVLPKTSYTVGAGLRFATSKTSEMQIGYRYEGGNGVSGSSAQVRGAWSF
jgi:uncharacterized protein with beta-barrel porin domain